MPYFLRGKCVVKGTKDNPGKTVKCHPTRAKALAHLRALYVHVEDAIMKALGEGQGVGGPRQGVGGVGRCVCPECGATIKHERGMPCMEQVCPECAAKMEPLAAVVEKMMQGNTILAYKDIDGDTDRWLAVSSAEVRDRQGEVFTTKSMDWDMNYIKRTGAWPELRMYHVRGFKLGKCDHMERIGIYAVESGYWYKTPFAQAVKDLVVDNKGRWKVSRGFFPVESAGQCPGCDADLTVALVNYALGVMCSTCKAYHRKPSMLKDLRVLRSITFDISITDVPAVTETGITAYTILSK